MSELDLEAELTSFQQELAQPKPRRGRQPGSKNGSTKGVKITELREGFQTLISAGNNIFQSSGKHAMYALASDEIKALSEALALEFSVNPRLQKLMMGFGKVSPHLALMQCIAGIGLSRWVLYQQVKAREAAQPAFNFGATETPTPISNEIPSDLPPQERIRAVRP